MPSFDPLILKPQTLMEERRWFTSQDVAGLFDKGWTLAAKHAGWACVRLNNEVVWFKPHLVTLDEIVRELGEITCSSQQVTATQTPALSATD